MRILFALGTELIIVEVKNKTVYFTNAIGKVTTIEGLKLSKSGVEKEFPDLAGNEDWKKITIQRFKDKINEMNTEEEIGNYLIEDLKKYGYIAQWIQKSGFRPQKLK